MRLKTAANVQWGIAISFCIILAPLFIVFKVIEFIRDKAWDANYALVQYVGNKLLLHSDEYKSGLFTNPKVKDWTAMQVWAKYKDNNNENPN